MTTISYGEPLRQGYRRMVRLLFTPFDIGRWFVIGFTAWLAALGEGGSFDLPSGPGGGGGEGGDFSGFGSFVRENLWIIVAVAMVVVVIALAVSLVLLWVGSRGKFMFLGNVVGQRAEVVAPWKEYKREGDSLFVWRFLFGLTILAVLVVLGGLAFLLMWPDIRAERFGPGSAAVVVAMALAGLALAVAAGYALAFLEDFVVPVMYRHRVGALDGWRRFLALFRLRPGPFLLYGLLRFGLHLGVGIAVLTVGLLTCCCGLALVLVPYLGTVILLPVSVLFRAFSLEFLRQFGPEFDVFEAPPAPVADPAA